MPRAEHHTRRARPGLTSVHWGVLALTGALLALPATVAAQPAAPSPDAWEVDLTPLYLWASEMDGRISAGDRSAPIFMSFSDAADSLAGAFSVHVEARRNRWGLLGDFNFVRLTSDTTFTTPVRSQSVDGTVKVDMVLFEAGASYLVRPETRFSVIGGIRTYTLGAELEFEGPVRELTPVDRSRTAASVFGGFTFRPALSEKWTLLSRADLGGGSAFTWSGTLGFDYRFTRRSSLAFGVHALGIDTGDAGQGTGAVEYDVTHYGPFFGMTVHFNGK